MFRDDLRNIYPWTKPPLEKRSRHSKRSFGLASFLHLKPKIPQTDFTCSLVGHSNFLSLAENSNIVWSWTHKLTFFAKTLKAACGPEESWIAFYLHPCKSSVSSQQNRNILYFLIDSFLHSFCWRLLEYNLKISFFHYVDEISPLSRRRFIINKTYVFAPLLHRR